MDKSSNHKLMKAGIIIVLVSAITALHFTTPIKHTYLHQIYQRSYYIPIVLGGYWFEMLGGLITAAGLAILFIVHILRDWSHHPDYSFQQYTEIPMYFVIALLVGYLSRLQRKTRERLLNAGTKLSIAYKKLNDAYDQLRHADRLAALGQLAAGIAHEIRNPLGSIQGAVDILAQGVSKEDAKTEFAKIARKEVARLDRLTSEILQFSKPAPPRQLESNPGEIIESACRLVADQATRQNINITRDIQATPPLILVDPEQVKQVLINILINAVQVQPNGGRILIKGYAEENSWVTSVQDAGPGIDPESLDRIFDPFFTTRREGTGLGLSISYQLVKNNGGRIWVDSDPGQGTSFFISFALPDAAQPTDQDA